MSFSLDKPRDSQHGSRTFSPSKSHELQHSTHFHSTHFQHRLQNVCILQRCNSEMTQITTATCESPNGQPSAQLIIRGEKKNHLKDHHFTALTKATVQQQSTKFKYYLKINSHWLFRRYKILFLST